MFDKRLQGSTIERVYWAVNSGSIPTIGKPFDSFLEAKRYAEDMVSASSPQAVIETRILFRYPKTHPVPGTLDSPVERVIVDYNVLIREPHPDERY
jgi:hypothetical protein